jgi:hypothetical protein
MAKGKDWISGAIKKPGALRATAKKEGGIAKDGNIKKSFIDKAAKEPGKLGQRARLAKTLGKMKK